MRKAEKANRDTRESLRNHIERYVRVKLYVELTFMIGSAIIRLNIHVPSHPLVWIRNHFRASWKVFIHVSATLTPGIGYELLAANLQKPHKFSACTLAGIRLAPDADKYVMPAHLALSPLIFSIIVTGNNWVFTDPCMQNTHMWIRAVTRRELRGHSHTCDMFLYRRWRTSVF